MDGQEWLLAVERFPVICHLETSHFGSRRFSSPACTCSAISDPVLQVSLSCCMHPDPQSPSCSWWSSLGDVSPKIANAFYFSPGFPFSFASFTILTSFSQLILISWSHRSLSSIA